jgi:hypothetical protein
MGLTRWLRNQWDRTAAVVSAVASGVAMLMGWRGVSRVSLPSEQIPYLASAAMFGLFALGIAATLWLSADLRDEWRKLDEIHHAIDRESNERSGGLLRRPEPTDGDRRLIEDQPQESALVPARASQSVSSG